MTVQMYTYVYILVLYIYYHVTNNLILLCSELSTANNPTPVPPSTKIRSRSDDEGLEASLLNQAKSKMKVCIQCTYVCVCACVCACVN